MPRIFDNLDKQLSQALKATLEVSHRADFCVGYFNLRGWGLVDEIIEQWPGGEGKCVRLMVGMQRMPGDDLKASLSLLSEDGMVDNQKAIRLKKQIVQEFREQLTLGAPNNRDEAALRRLSQQLRDSKVMVKLFLRHPLHAKLYLLHRVDPDNPTTGYLGSSNLTFAGLSKQGELNVDVLDSDTCVKLQSWFEDRWKDKFCLDISNELAEIIDESWAGDQTDLAPTPHEVYLKIAYHLSQEARAGLTEFNVPREFGDELFDFQTAAVKIAAHHLNKRDGVLLGDVVGLGKTLMATALARVFQDDYGLETLIICPPNLKKMWEDYVYHYRLLAQVMPSSKVQEDLPELRRYRLVIVDESHNFRNQEGKRYRAIKEYVSENESKVVLLSATPYNKSYQDLSAQLGLFIPEEEELSARPEALLKDIGEAEFKRRHQCPVRSLAAFDKSEHKDDWRELMRMYLVRRTRSFIKENYADTDENGRKYLTFKDGRLSYFPERIPRTVPFSLDSADPYAQLYSTSVVNAIDSLFLPRYGLGNYVETGTHATPGADEQTTIDQLGRAGRRLMGFCRTNLFKRLESSGPAFIESVERHVLRNFIFVHALENDLSVPIGPQESELLRSRALLDSRASDEDAEAIVDREDSEEASVVSGEMSEDGADTRASGATSATAVAVAPSSQDAAASEARVYGTQWTEEAYRNAASEIYGEYAGRKAHKFKWLNASLFKGSLRDHLLADARALMEILADCGEWEPKQDAKLNELEKLVSETHPDQKVLVFTQFADTVEYLAGELKKRGVSAIEGVTGHSDDPAAMAWRFSPESNDKRKSVPPEDELRVLIATDVLSEGQNLQDCAVVVNFDLPWAIIQLIQRAGRVDRIGQQAEDITCYTFLPADGVEQVINLRQRVLDRLEENQEVVGTDESFFEGEASEHSLRDLYNEKSGILEGEEDSEVDLASHAYQIWKNATDGKPALARKIENLPEVVYATKHHDPAAVGPQGVLVYLRTQQSNDALAWVDDSGNSVTESQLSILQAAHCLPEEPALERHEDHHELVEKGVRHILSEQGTVGGQLGPPSSARRRTYERLKAYATTLQGTLYESEELHRALDELFTYPLRQSAADTLNRQLRADSSSEQIADLVVNLRDEDKLCLVHEEAETKEPKIICSMGLFDRGTVGGG